VTLRARFAIITATAVAVAVLVVTTFAWFATRRELYDEVDRTLLARAERVAEAPRSPDGLLPLVPGADSAFQDPFGETFVQLIRRDGFVLAEADQAVIPVTDRDLAVAQGSAGAYFRSARAGGQHLRVLTTPYTRGRALQVARPLDEVDRTTRGLALVLVGVAGIGVAGAAAVGFLTARRALRPVERVAAAAEHIAASQELTARIEVERDDETGRLARAFNDMVAALAASRAQQQQLVVDASHELRTPLTSLRTNIELLARADDMEPEQRREVLADATEELGQLTHLVGELVELATDPHALDQEPVPVHLDEMARRAAERAERRSGLTVRVDARPSVVPGRAALLERAIANLLDNACKWSPPGAEIEVVVAGGTISVRDRGPGIPDAERARVFDRFYRAPGAQAVPGSGLGLAIVRQIVELHGGEVFVEPAPGGGTLAGFRLPSSGE
jgi:two-component system sensor histidine kinase MprB